MDTVQLLTVLLGQLAVIAGDPALGYRGAALTQALTLISQLAAKGEAARAELEALCAHVDLMVQQGREPTKDEWAQLRELSKMYHDILNPPPPAPDGGDVAVNN